MLQRLARTSYHRRWWVVAAWLVLLVGLNALNSAAGGTFRDEFKLPGSESQDAVDLLQAKGFDTLGGFQGTLVIQATGDGGVNNPEVKAYVDDLLEQIGASVPDTEVVSPYWRRAPARSPRTARSPTRRSTWPSATPTSSPTPARRSGRSSTTPRPTCRPPPASSWAATSSSSPPSSPARAWA